jgi:hypothetical protein
MKAAPDLGSSVADNSLKNALRAMIYIHGLASTMTNKIYVVDPGS